MLSGREGGTEGGREKGREEKRAVEAERKKFEGVRGRRGKRNMY